MATEPTVFQHIADWMGQNGNALVLVGVLGWGLRTEKRLSMVEKTSEQNRMEVLAKIEQNRSERELELKHVNETLQQILSAVTRNEEKLEGVHDRQIVVMTTQTAMIEQSKMDRIALNTLAQNLKCPLIEKEVIPR